MPSATQALHDRIALVFDFDQTLAPDSLGALLRRLGEDPDAFAREQVEPRSADGWDTILARCYALLEVSRAHDHAITKELLETVGRELPLIDGLPDAFEGIRKAADAVAPGVSVEFYVLSAGFADIIEASPIAEHCTAIWGGTFLFGDDGRILFPKRVITYGQKVRYLMALAKGLGVQGHDAPADVWRDVPAEDWYVPLDQVVYVGDGSSDLPAFHLMNEHGGFAIAVAKDVDESSWADEHDVHPNRRVLNVARADYTDGAELQRSLCLAAESAARLVALRRLGRGE